VRWQDASVTGVEALAAAIEELDDGGGTEDFVTFGTEAFAVLGWASEGIGTVGLGLCAGFFCIAFFGALALPLASAEAFAVLGWATEGIGTVGLGLCAGFFCIAFFGVLALPLALASAEAFEARLNSSMAFFACLANLAWRLAHSLGKSSSLLILEGSAH
jgi:hypothetical protein